MVGALQRLADRALDLAELVQVLAGAEPSPRAGDDDSAHRGISSLLERSRGGPRAASRLNALKTSGRLSVIVRTPPSRPVSTSLMPRPYRGAVGHRRLTRSRYSVTAMGSTGLAASFAFVAGLGGAVQIAAQGRLGDRIGSLEALALRRPRGAATTLVVLLVARRSLDGLRAGSTGPQVDARSAGS